MKNDSEQSAGAIDRGQSVTGGLILFVLAVIILTVFTYSVVMGWSL